MTVEEIFFTSGITIFGGVLVFVIGQLCLKFLIEPIKDQKETIGKISHTLSYYAHNFYNPGSSTGNTEASHTLKNLAFLFSVKTYAISLYSVFAKIGFIVKKHNADEAANQLLKLSDSVISGKSLDNDAIIRKIRDLLNLEHE